LGAGEGESSEAGGTGNEEGIGGGDQRAADGEIFFPSGVAIFDNFNVIFAGGEIEDIVGGGDETIVDINAGFLGGGGDREETGFAREGGIERIDLVETEVSSGPAHGNISAADDDTGGNDGVDDANEGATSEGIGFRLGGWSGNFGRSGDFFYWHGRLLYNRDYDKAKDGEDV